MKAFKMSLISVIIFIVIGLSFTQDEEELQPFMDDISTKRICRNEKDYVDGVVVFRDRFWVIVDHMYYEFIWKEKPFLYQAEGPQKLALQEYDRSWGQRDERVRGKSFQTCILCAVLSSPIEGRLLGGFYHNVLEVNITLDKGINRVKVDLIGRNLTMDNHPAFNDDGDLINDLIYDEPLPYNSKYMSVKDYDTYMSRRQVIFFHNEANLNYMYHTKARMEDAEELTEDIETPQHKTGFRSKARSHINSLLKIPGFNSHSFDSLPIILEYYTLDLYVITNDEHNPLLWYNSFKYEDFAKTWKNVSIPKGYTYKAFIPSLDDDLGYLGSSLEPFLSFSYNVIAEPYRKKSKERGPSFLFSLEWSESMEPFLKKTQRPGMSIFGCTYESQSSFILYIVFGVVIVLLIVILILLIGFVSYNYLIGKKRIIIVRKGHRSMSQKRSISLNRGSSRNKTIGDDEDKRSASLGSEGTHVTVDKKIKI